MVQHVRHVSAGQVEVSAGLQVLGRPRHQHVVAHPAVLHKAVDCRAGVGGRVWWAGSGGGGAQQCGGPGKAYAMAASQLLDGATHSLLFWAIVAHPALNSSSVTLWL